ncbi:hypothetical protein HNY73_021090 [Argiope bruennichi]|uniref:Uncharacterized protein n=1 Tax=Argiope bruennichi TaxID=94029 RepID=A0A8T0EA92_ARGBR|nr:hypothetical protein HNY73_021090 [Argiope bruennichi]
MNAIREGAGAALWVMVLLSFWRLWVMSARTVALWRFFWRGVMSARTVALWKVVLAGVGNECEDCGLVEVVLAAWVMSARTVALWRLFWRRG